MKISMSEAEIKEAIIAWLRTKLEFASLEPKDVSLGSYTIGNGQSMVRADIDLGLGNVFLAPKTIVVRCSPPSQEEMVRSEVGQTSTCQGHPHSMPIMPECPQWTSSSVIPEEMTHWSISEKEIMEKRRVEFEEKLSHSQPMPVMPKCLQPNMDFTYRELSDSEILAMHEAELRAYYESRGTIFVRQPPSPMMNPPQSPRDFTSGERDD